ncbi:MAG TPA: aminopeptidase [Anaerolineaceae bacterium]|nr:aminopeptidase [Anaerolineaceae bacterium]
MRDERVEKLADLLVNYSIGVQPGWKVVIRGGAAGAPLMKEVYKHVLLAGGHPLVMADLPGIQETFFRCATDEQLQFIHEPVKHIYENYEASIAIISEENTRAMTSVNPERRLMHRRAFEPVFNRYLERAGRGELKWTVTLFPTQAHAQDAEMSLAEYEDFVYRACMPDMDDPIGYWQGVHDRQERVIEWLKGKDAVHVVGPETDLRLSIAGRRFINCACDANVPDGEIFTGPVETSANGHVYFSYPAIIDGQMVSGIRLWFENGKVVKATAEKNEAYLLKTIDTDEGARYLGEFAIGTNEGIQKFTGQILFDEKIGGSFHMALGTGYPETGSVNKSAIHWDMVCDLRKGGEIWVDGELMYRDGNFVIG